MTKRQDFFGDDNNSPISEAFRILRSNLYFLNDENNSRMIVFTSSIPGEGKTTAASNYALSVAMNGEKVLIIDCDLRRPRVHTIFDASNEHCLYDLLIGDKSKDAVIQKNVRENLDLIPGKYLNLNPTEILQSKKTMKFLDEIKKDYDLVVLDTPPVAVGTEAGMLSKKSDGVVLICGYDMVNKRQLEYTTKFLRRAGTNIYGVVVNKIDNSGYNYGSYSYYNNYYEYYHDYSKGK
jgi:capsular exopolysaccharide synthesis family protein